MKTSNRFCAIFPFILAAIFADVARADTFGNAANQFDITFVTIGNPGNPADTGDGSDFQPGIQNLGSVPQVYRIGKYEVSRDMIIKANSVGNLAITLFDMSAYGGNGANRPATGVSWNEAARFVNWLNTSSGSVPAYKFSLQPGQTGYSANDNIQLWTPSDAGYNPNNLYRNSLARYFLPSIDEWYKAAYYDPNSGTYFDYPTGSNSAPTAVFSGTAPGTAVFNHSESSGPAEITLAGGLSPYGTMAQGGNVYEYEETDYDFVNDSSSSERGERGGRWGGSFSVMSSSLRFSSDPTLESDNTVGLRIASSVVPEPSTLALAALALIPFAGRVRRAKKGTSSHAGKFRFASLAMAIGAIPAISLSVASSVQAQTIRIEESQISLVGAWDIEDGFSEYSGGRAAVVNYDVYDSNAYATFGFSGTGITWIGAKTYNGGLFDWIVDEGTANQRSGTINTYSAIVHRSTTELLSNNLAAGSHTFKFKTEGVNGTTGAHSLPSETYIDAFDIASTVPEPSTLILTAIVPLFWRKRHASNFSRARGGDFRCATPAKAAAFAVESATAARPLRYE